MPPSFRVREKQRSANAMDLARDWRSAQQSIESEHADAMWEQSFRRLRRRQDHPMFIACSLHPESLNESLRLGFCSNFEMAGVKFVYVLVGCYHVLMVVCPVPVSVMVWFVIPPS